MTAKNVFRKAAQSLLVAKTVVLNHTTLVSECLDRSKVLDFLSGMSSDTLH